MGKWLLLGSVVVLALGAGVGFAVTRAADDTGSALSAEEAKAFVDYHNEKRDEVKVPHVEWDNDIAKFAQQWADHIAETGVFDHRPEEEGEFKQKYGENLGAGSGGSYGAAKAATDWYKEKQAYEDGKHAGHYTQMVWSKSTKIGAGKAVIKEGQYKGWTVIVGDYDPRGNVGGEKPY